MKVPFPTGDELRQQLRGSDCLAAEAAVKGETEEECLERLVGIAEQARAHWLLTLLRKATAR